MSEAYDLRPNLKDKPGSQGTLFQVKDKGLLNPQQRWPRGYTPERQAEVKDALKDTPIVGLGSGVRDTGNPESIRRIDPPRVDRDGNPRYAEYPQTEARVVGAIARSTVPVEHLAGLTRIHDQPAPGHAATYWPPTKEMAVRIHQKDRVGEGELIHELGHHASFAHTHEGKSTAQEVAALQFPPDPHGSPLQVANRSYQIEPGVEEAVADNYYMKHFRPHGRNPQPLPADAPALYESRRDTKALDKDYPGYTDVRPPKKPGSLSPIQFQTYADAKRETLF